MTMVARIRSIRKEEVEITLADIERLLGRNIPANAVMTLREVDSTVEIKVSANLILTLAFEEAFSL